MENIRNRLLQLYNSRVAGELSDEESEELSELLRLNDVEDLLSSTMFQVWAKNAESQLSGGLSKVQIDQLISRISVDEEVTIVRRSHRVHFLKTAWFRNAAAIILLFSIGAYLWNTQQKEKPQVVETKPVPAKNDIAPGSNRAVLTLSDGRKVELTAETKTIAESGTSIQNTNGILKYGKGEQAVSNTLSTPRGGQYQLTLPDGTKVWLNAATSLIYPTAFIGKERRVKMEGEGYFEVAKDKSKKFVVESGGVSTEVLGTNFNINTYTDEPLKSVTVLEGIVRVTQDQKQLLIKPGEQAVIGNDNLVLNADADTSTVMGWRNSIFKFNKTPLKVAMRQLARWYDLTVVYKTEPAVELGGSMGRDLTLNQALMLLSDMGVKYKLNGRILELQ